MVFSLMRNLALEYKKIVLFSFRRLSFQNLNQRRPYVARFTRLRLGHNRFTSHVFESGPNQSPLCLRHSVEKIYNFPQFNYFLFCRRLPQDFIALAIMFPNGSYKFCKYFHFLHSISSVFNIYNFDLQLAFLFLLH